jgi:hypothetical protein
MSTYFTVFRDGEIYRLYYCGWELDLEQSRGDGSGLSRAHPMWICYAESEDGLRWRRPELDIVPWEGQRTNIVWRGAGEKQHGVHGFAPFKDPNPDCDPAAAYKAVGADRRATQGHLYAMGSPDGIHWSLLREEPILRHDEDGKFDSQNLAFWDGYRGEYRAYVRDFRHGRRAIRTATSRDFLDWTATQWLEYPGAPEEQLYTNQVQPYRRAPHIFVGFPSRYVQREWSPAIEDLPEPEHRQRRAQVNERFGTAVTDGLFMSSRDGRTFRRWGEAFIRPGAQLRGNWAYGDNYQGWGMIQTPSALEGAPPELSFYAREGVWRGTEVSLRRYSLRLDGFVSLNAPRSGAEFTTRPVVFEGNRLELNFSTSAAGSLRVEIQDPAGTPITGFSEEDCVPVIGDELSRRVRWTEGDELSHLSGRPVRLRVLMQDADLYAFRFCGEEGKAMR